LILQLELRLDVLLKLLHLDYTVMIQLVYHNGETWHVKAVLEEQQQHCRFHADTCKLRRHCPFAAMIFVYTIL